MRASRSVGSTTAPHFVILSTSFVHADLLRRCWRMMRASWHSRQAVVALACIAPAGSSAATLAPAGFWAWAANGEAAANTSRARKIPDQQMRLRGLKPGSSMKRDAALKRRSSTSLRVFSFSRALNRSRDLSRNVSGNMDLHLIYGVVKITAGIPHWRGGLGASLAVGGARLESIVAAFTRFPIVGPKAPGIVRLIVAQLCWNPGGAAVGRNLDLFYVGFPSPGCAMHADNAG